MTVVVTDEMVEELADELRGPGDGVSEIMEVSFPITITECEFMEDFDTVYYYPSLPEGAPMSVQGAFSIVNKSPSVGGVWMWDNHDFISMYLDDDVDYDEEDVEFAGDFGPDDIEYYPEFLHLSYRAAKDFLEAVGVLIQKTYLKLQTEGYVVLPLDLFDYQVYGMYDGSRGRWVRENCADQLAGVHGDEVKQAYESLLEYVK